MKIKTLLVLVLLFIATSCNKYIENVRIDGYWRIWKADDMSKDMIIHIHKVNDNYIGNVYKKNNNKFINEFVDSNAVFFTSINVLSKVQYKFVKAKIGAELFSNYGLSTSQEYTTMVENVDTLRLIAKDNYTRSPDIVLVRCKYKP